MYKYKPVKKTSLKVNQSYKGETIEQKIDRILNNKEPLSDGAPRIYTERKDGVKPEYDIRTDRFEIAVDAMDAVSKAKLAKREERHKEYERKKEGGSEGGKEDISGAKPVQGTTPNES